MVVIVARVAHGAVLAPLARAGDSIEEVVPNATL